MDFEKNRVSHLLDKKKKLAIQTVGSESGAQVRWAYEQPLMSSLQNQARYIVIRTS